MQCAKCIYVHMCMSYIRECMSVSFETVCLFCCDSWNLKNYLMNTIRKIFRRTSYIHKGISISKQPVYFVAILRIRKNCLENAICKIYVHKSHLWGRLQTKLTRGGR